MSSPEDSDVVSNVTRTLQIIVAALVTGPLFFLAIALYLRSQPKPAPPAAAPAAVRAPAPVVSTLPLITVVAFVFSAVVVPMSLLVPRLTTSAALKQIAAGTWNPAATGRRDDQAPPDVSAMSDTVKLVAVYQTQTILGAAMNEGVAFLAAIAYFLEGHPAALALAVVLVIGVAARYPRLAAVEPWIETRREALDALRHTAP